MCESCSSNGLGRREFLAVTGALGATGMLSMAQASVMDAPAGQSQPKREKKPARVLAAFLYPPADVVNAGQMEDSWRVHNWFTWPGNQFEPERQAEKFTAKIKDIAARIGIEVQFVPQAIYQEAKVEEFIASAKVAKPDAVLIVNFWNTLSRWSYRMARESAPTAIVYHSLGSNHQLPPEYLRKADGFYYIHSMENWDELERGLRAVHARKMLAQSRLLRLSGRTKSPAATREPRLDVELLSVPAEEFNTLFDAVKADDPLVREALTLKQDAARVLDVTDAYFVDAMRAHRAVGQIMERYGADAIAIECLLLKHRKPCVSFAINNGALIPCGCENHLDGTLSLAA